MLRGDAFKIEEQLKLWRTRRSIQRCAKKNTTQDHQDSCSMCTVHTGKTDAKRFVCSRNKNVLKEQAGTTGTQFVGVDTGLDQLLGR